MNELRDINNVTTYIIEEDIFFIPSSNKLMTSKGNVEITLLSAASAILQILIDRQGQLVSKNELVYVGWEIHGLHVSDNTFYQNILTLRRGIRKCGIAQDIIKTIPRKGLVISSSVKISEVKNKKSVANENSKNYISILKKRCEIFLKRKVFFCWLCKIANKKIILAYTICSILGLFFGFYSSTPTSYLSHYHYVDLINNCQLNIENNISNGEDVENFMKKSNIYCMNNESIYYATYRYIPRASIIKCESSIKNNNNCISHYFLEK